MLGYMLVFQQRDKEFLKRLIEPINQSLGTNYGVAHDGLHNPKLPKLLGDEAFLDCEECFKVMKH